MQNQLNLSRISKPAAPAGIITRYSLFQKLDESASKKLILLNAPAGYGKSTLINHFLNEKKSKYAWIRLHNDINSAYIFLLYIIEALKKINSKFGNETLTTLSLLGKDPSRIISNDSAFISLLNIFSNEFTLQFEEEIILVLDDLHELSSQSWLKQFLELMLQDTPDNLKFVITARYLPELNISPLKAKRNILELTQKELTIDKTEFSSLADKLYNISFSENESEMIVKYIGGWITGIHLLLQASEPADRTAYINKGSLPENLFEFFAYEVFTKLDDKIKDFLLKTSFLEDFDPEFCNKLLNINDSQSIIELLLERNIFIETIKSPDPEQQRIKYSYNQLFRNFLNEKALSLPPQELTNIYKTIALLYIERNMHGPAFEYFLKAGENDSALKELNSFFNDHFQQSGFEILWKYLNSFSSSFIENNKLLLYYKGLLLKFYKGEIEQALICFNMAIELNENSTDTQFTILCTQAKVGILLTFGKGRINEAIEILNNILNDNASPLDNAKTYHLLGNSYFNINKPDISESYLAKALEICRSYPDSELEHDVYSMLGNIKITNGDFIQSNHYYELALNKTTGLFKKIVILGNLTVLYSRSGKFSKAKELLERSQELLNKFKTPIFELIVKMTEYSLIYEIGDYSSAYKLAEQIKDMALKLHNSNFIFLSYQFLGECCYYSGNPVKSVEFYNLAGKYIDESNETDEILLSLLITISKMQSANDADIETKLLRAYTFLDTVNSNYDKTIAGFYLAKFYLKSGNVLTASKYFEKSIESAAGKEYFSFLLREYIFSDTVFNQPEFYPGIKSILENLKLDLFDLAELPWISAEYKNSLNEFIDRSYDLKMKIFGTPEFYVKNIPVKESEWKRKKRKLILCFLLMNKQNTLSKDRIIDMFFGDSSAENSDNLFHQSVSNIRTALKSAYTDSVSGGGKEISRAPEKQFIVYEGKQLKISPGISVYSDSGLFDMLIQKASAAENTREQLNYLNNAVNLYSGDALEGFYEPWCEEVRSEYRTKYINALEIYTDLLIKDINFDDALKYAEILHHKEPFNEKGIEVLISSLIRLGKSSQAKERLSAIKELFKAELNENIPAELEKKLMLMFDK